MLQSVHQNWFRADLISYHPRRDFKLIKSRSKPIKRRHQSANQRARISLKPPRAIYLESVLILFAIQKMVAILEMSVLVKNGRVKRIL